MDKRKILQRISRGLQWENKPPKLKRSILIFNETAIVLKLVAFKACIHNCLYEQS